MQIKADGIWWIESTSDAFPKARCNLHSPSDCLLQDQICAAPECQFLCPHMYMCDAHCYDFNNGYLCEHIHRAHSLFSEVSQMQENGQSTDI